MGKKTCVAFFASVIFVFNYFQISPDQAIKQDREDEAGEDEDEQDAPDVMIEVPYEYEDYEIVEKEVSNATSCSMFLAIPGNYEMYAHRDTYFYFASRRLLKVI